MARSKVAEHLSELLLDKEDVRKNILIQGEHYDIDCNETRQVVESATAVVKSSIQDG